MTGAPSPPPAAVPLPARRHGPALGVPQLTTPASCPGPWLPHALTHALTHALPHALWRRAAAHGHWHRPLTRCSDGRDARGLQGCHHGRHRLWPRRCCRRCAASSRRLSARASSAGRREVRRQMRPRSRQMRREIRPDRPRWRTRRTHSCTPRRARATHRAPRASPCRPRSTTAARARPATPPVPAAARRRCLRSPPRPPPPLRARIARLLRLMMLRACCG